MFNDNNNNFNNDEINDKINQWQDYVNEHGDEIKKAGKKLAAGAGLVIGAKIVATGMILIGIPVLIHKVNKLEKNEAQAFNDAMFD
jgi:hypothetical protein